jgi:hypothetical protein
VTEDELDALEREAADADYGMSPGAVSVLVAEVRRLRDGVRVEQSSCAAAQLNINRLKAVLIAARDASDPRAFIHRVLTTPAYAEMDGHVARLRAAERLAEAVDAWQREHGALLWEPVYAALDAYRKARAPTR